MKKLIILFMMIMLILCSSCDFIKERFLDDEPLYGGGHIKGTVYTPSPKPTETPSE